MVRPARRTEWKAAPGKLGLAAEPDSWTVPSERLQWIVGQEVAGTLAPAEAPDSWRAWNELSERTAPRMAVVKWSAWMSAMEPFSAWTGRCLLVALAES